MTRRELTEDELRERYERNQARVGLASNALGLTAGGVALGSALKDKRLKHGGPTAQAVYRAGKKIPSPIKAGLKKLPKDKSKKVAAGLALGAVGLQAANTAGDVVANRVLARESKVEKREFNSGAVTGRRLDAKPERVEKNYISGSGGRIVNRGANYVLKPPRSEEELTQLARAAKTRQHEAKARKATSKSRQAQQLAYKQAKSKAVAEGKAPPTREQFFGKANKKVRAGLDLADQMARQMRRDAAIAGRAPVGRSAPVSRRLKDAARDKGTSLDTIGLQAHSESRALARRKKPDGRPDYVGKAYDRERDRNRNQGIAIGAGGVGSVYLGHKAANQFETVAGRSGYPGKKPTAVQLRPTKPGAKISNPKKAALYGAGALASGGTALYLHDRSRKKENKGWT